MLVGIAIIAICVAFVCIWSCFLLLLFTNYIQAILGPVVLLLLLLLLGFFERVFAVLDSNFLSLLFEVLISAIAEDDFFFFLSEDFEAAELLRRVLLSDF